MQKERAVLQQAKDTTIELAEMWRREAEHQATLAQAAGGAEQHLEQLRVRMPLKPWTPLHRLLADPLVLFCVLGVGLDHGLMLLSACFMLCSAPEVMPLLETTAFAVLHWFLVRLLRPSR